MFMESSLQNSSVIKIIPQFIRRHNGVSTQKIIQNPLRFLVAHSMLHLAGYDHIEDAEREQMERMQKEILNQLEIFR